jgi:DNA-binding NarL/FixJ family response regulator
MSSMTALETAAGRIEQPVVVAATGADEMVRRRAVAALANEGYEVSDQTPEPAELRADDGTRRTDAVVLICRSSAEERAAAIRAARSRLPEAHVVIVATADSNGMHKAFEAGADGFVFESDLEAALGATVRAVCAGQVVVPPVMRSSVVRPALTHREKQTLGLAVLGLTNGEIAQRLFLAESTVKCHMTSIFSKLGVRSRSEAAAHVLDPNYGLGLGILRLSSGEPTEKFR